jgi:apolipoprotein N-acyltransferase
VKFSDNLNLLINKKRTFNWRTCLLLCVAGALASLCFAPFFWSFVLFVALPILVVCLRSLSDDAKIYHDFLYGFAFGLGHFLVNTYWIANALLIDAATYGWFIPFATFGLSAVLAIYIGLVAILMRHKRGAPIIPYSFAFAACWLLAELLRSHLFSGFPWNLLGYVFTSNNVSIQAASLFGVYGLSAISALLALVPLWWLERRIMATWLALGALLMLLGFGAWRLHENPTSYYQNIRLRLVQAAIPQQLKWDPQHKLEAFKQHIALSQVPASTSPTHIIWSESAMTSPFKQDDYPAKILSEIASPFGSLITGVVRVAKEPSGRILLYNSMQAITSAGVIDAIYDKRALVPFGEYMPLRSWLPFKKLTEGTVDFQAGDSQNIQVTKGAPPFYTIICYESIFPTLSQNQGAHWLLNLTNDTWFGDSAGPRQHLQMSRMRAVEQGLPLVRSAGSGISAVIDPYGRILASLDINQKGVLDYDLPQPANKKPIAANYSLHIAIIFLLLFATIGNIFGIMNKIVSKKFILLGFCGLLSACGDTSVREELGLVRNPPNEFNVVSRAPLTVPKEFFLYSPEELAGRELPNESSSIAKGALLGDDGVEKAQYLEKYQTGAANAVTAEVDAVNKTALPSSGESGLLNKIKVNEASPNIRELLADENVEAAAKEDDILENLKDPIIEKEPIIDAVKERERLQNNKQKGEAVNKGDIPTVTEKKTWFDRLF